MAPPPDRDLGLLSVACAGVLGFAAATRQLALAPLSAPDLAFFTQSAWNAAAGRGFTQTALSFDGQSIWSSVHLSPIRALHIAIVGLGAPGLATLHGLAVGLGVWATISLARRAGAGRRVSAAVALAATLHPLTLTVATADARPLVFLVPAILCAAAAIQARHRLGLVAAVLLALAAREEAPFALLALMPWAWTHRRSDAILLAGFAGLGFAVPWWVWGHGSNIATNVDLAGTLANILSGERALFRDMDEVRFMALCLLGAPTALRAPRLAIPAAAAWLWLATLSGLEPAHDRGAGAHYLSIVAPFLFAAAAVGAGRLTPRLSHRPTLSRFAPTALVGCALIVAAPTLLRVVSWTGDALGADAHTSARQSLIAPIRDHPGGVLSDHWAAPTLATRSELYILGNFGLEDGHLEDVLTRIDWAVLPADSQPGSPHPDLHRWRDALTQAGFEVTGTGGDADRWQRLRPRRP